MLEHMHVKPSSGATQNTVIACLNTGHIWVFKWMATREESVAKVFLFYSINALQCPALSIEQGFIRNTSNSTDKGTSNFI